MKRPSLLLFLSICTFTAASSQTTFFVNPGIKAGYIFGKDGGFTFGYELSFVLLDVNRNAPGYGLVIDYDWPKGAKRLHIGFECMYAVGLDVGPSFVWGKDSLATGWSVIPFVLTPELLLPAYYYTSMPGSGNDIHEAGMYLKLPIPTAPIR